MPQGIHGAIWSEVQSETEFDLPAQEPLTLVSYECGDDLQSVLIITLRNAGGASTRGTFLYRQETEVTSTPNGVITKAARA